MGKILERLEFDKIKEEKAQVFLLTVWTRDKSLGAKVEVICVSDGMEHTIDWSDDYQTPETMMTISSGAVR